MPGTELVEFVKKSIVPEATIRRIRFERTEKNEALRNKLYIRNAPYFIFGFFVFIWIVEPHWVPFVFLVIPSGIGAVVAYNYGTENPIKKLAGWRIMRFCYGLFRRGWQGIGSGKQKVLYLK